jgi:general secretion pathway protein G
MMNRRIQRRGFTLIELLLVMVILAVLAGVAVPTYMGYAKSSKINAAKATISMVKQSLQNFEVEYDRFPSNEEGLSALVSQPAGLPNWHPFMEKNPVDPWGNPIQYKVNDDGSYNLYSFGPDQQDGTPDDITKDSL